ncbi:MAG: MerR family DNA-binding transcriptional regulator [Ilumatobacteraceae bacterium]|jgi:DNA-binding transcriptional MerR regulator|nr:MerR family DNA-binding transcriptional regulator [Ilumatobacteraceae bacterium]
MPEATDTGYLSIGEVLGLLLEEFPDVTISKIRFLESQGLIAPERTPSGYRKFYDADIELLRTILREQREHYLPLRVIKDRLDSGELDPTGDLSAPHPRPADLDGDPTPVAAEVPSASVAAHPAARRGSSGHQPAEPEPTDDHTPVVPQLLPGVLLDRGELCAMTGVSATELAQLEEFGIVAPRGRGPEALFQDEAVETARIAVELLRSGIDARHLRGWRTAAEREALLYEQLITPRLRQRNPEARAEALDQLRRLDALGAKLRDAMMRAALRHHFES